MATWQLWTLIGVGFFLTGSIAVSTRLIAYHTENTAFLLRQIEQRLSHFRSHEG
jgi:hypothetical protein